MENFDIGSCSHKGDRVEIDMKAPFETVNVAVSMFGERVARDKITKKRLDIPEEKVMLIIFFRLCFFVYEA